MSDTAQAAAQANQSFRDLTVTTAGLSKQIGFFEKRISKAKLMLMDTTAGSVVIYTAAMMKASRAMLKMHEDEEEGEKMHKNMTIAQKGLYKAVFQFTPALKALGKMHEKLAADMDENNKSGQRMRMWLLRSGTYVVMLAIGLLALAAAFVATDLVLNGMNSTTLEATKNHENLHGALQGVATLLTGQEGASAWDLFTGSLLIAGVVATIFTAKAGLVAGIVALVGSAFRLGQQHLGGFTGGLMLAMPTLIGIMGTIALTTKKLKWMRAAIMLVKNAFGVTLPAAALAGMVLIAAGVIGLFAIATGRVEEGKETIVYAFTAIALAVGAILLGLSAAVAVPIALVALFLADTYNLMTGGLDNFTGTWSDRFERLGSWMGTKWEEFMSPINDSWTDLSTRVDNFVTNLQFAWGIVKTAFFDRFGDEIDTVKMAWNAMLGNETLNAIMDATWNAFVTFANPAIDLYNSIPKLDNIDKLEKRAKGGPVTGGQPYLVGEKGPEIFTPGSSGNITANDQIGGGQNITLNINVGGVTDRTDKRALAREIGDMLTQELRRTGGAPTRGRF